MISERLDLPDGRAATIFVRRADALERFRESAAAQFIDDDDDRERALREVLSSPVVYVDSHAGLDPADVQHVFVRKSDAQGEQPIFACVIATQMRVEKMLDSVPWVAETFSFQVSAGRIVTPAATIAAFETWFGRAFPGMPLPVICFARLTESVDHLAEEDFSDVSPVQDDELPSSFEDIESLVSPAAA